LGFESEIERRYDYDGTNDFRWNSLKMKEERIEMRNMIMVE